MHGILRQLASAGSDVTHMRSSQESEPSIAAVCGSLDENATRFASCTRLQSHGMEIIQVSLQCVMQCNPSIRRSLKLDSSFYVHGLWRSTDELAVVWASM